MHIITQHYYYTLDNRHNRCGPNHVGATDRYIVDAAIYYNVIIMLLLLLYERTYIYYLLSAIVHEIT